MSASEPHFPSAIAFQLAARLEQYELDMDRMVACPTDPDLYQRVGRHMDEMRLYAASLPEVSVAWVEVLIRHFELTHCLWRVQQGQADMEERARLQGLHGESVHRLARKCARLIPASG